VRAVSEIDSRPLATGLVALQNKNRELFALPS
jgi:hypothetical protein